MPYFIYTGHASCTIAILVGWLIEIGLLVSHFMIQLMTLFTINHFIHLFYVVLTFNHHALDLKITDNKHGFVTFVFLLLIPAILWMVRKMNALLYTLVIVHLINVTYFICETFLSKVTEDRPAYHNQLGIVVLSAAVLYVLYRSIRENIRF